jgi:CO dehydrogenase/acetyl-CoA synthase beta subunit
MSVFDVYIKKIAEYIDIMAGKRRQVRIMSHPGGSNNLTEGLPVRVGHGAQTRVILREDTGVELGSPGMISCAFVLWTADNSLVKDGRITLIGPDIDESVGNSLPFGQVIIAGGTKLGDEYQLTLEQDQYISDRIEGYMIRSVPHKVWSRVSREAVNKGFCFETLGRALMGIIKTESSLVEATEVLFVTSSKEDVGELENIARQVKKITREINRKRFTTEDDGVYVCVSGLDCTACQDQAICNDIRQVMNLRKPDSRNLTEERK